MENKDFDLKNLPVECQDSSISKDDFKLIDSESIVHEQKFQTKPTTFLKDCFRRFKKNKSSVVAGIILGVLLVLSFTIPVIDRNDITSEHPESTYLEPKLFNAGTGFWDGTKKWEKIPVDTGENGFNETNKQENWWPNPERFKNHNAISKKQFSDVTFTSGQTKFGKEGYIKFGYYYNNEEDQVEFKTRPMTVREDNKPDDTTFTLDATDRILLTSFDTYNLEKLQELEGNKSGVELPENYVLAPVSLAFSYEVTTKDEDDKPVIKEEYVTLLEAKDVFNIGSKISSRSEAPVDLAALIRSKTLEKVPDQKFEKATFSVIMENQHNQKNTCALIRSIVFDATLKASKFEEAFKLASFSDATECVLRTINEPEPNASRKNRAYWLCTGIKTIHMSKVVYASFVYDSYEAAYGVMEFKSFPVVKLEEYAGKKYKYIKWNVESEDDGEGTPYHITADSEWKVLDKKNSPIVEFLDVRCDESSGTIIVDAMVSYYRYYGYKNMPRYLMGTNKKGLDMLKYVFEGLRTSLLLGIVTFVICFIFGLLWGSISGYFGGLVDLVMERITDILAGVPWVVVMTLAIIKLSNVEVNGVFFFKENQFLMFIIALCFTGWIGTAATTRTQFYRFRGREYVLASRTLGASDARLIAKHILPNAMGTIITGAVLMIPSVIFTEATISYLGIGFKDMSIPSLGVILSANQGELTTNPYLLIFPAVVIALLMISFNLFGNGLRDAVNPSLKGEDE